MRHKGDTGFASQSSHRPNMGMARVLPPAPPFAGHAEPRSFGRFILSRVGSVTMSGSTQSFTSDLDDILGTKKPAMEIRAGGKTVSADELANLIGISARQVREWASRGVLQRSGNGRYDERESVRAYCASLRVSASARAGSSTLTTERTRLAREQADATALKNAIARGEMVDAKEVEFVWATVLRDVRAAMLAIPGRVASRSTFSASQLATLDQEIRLSLSDIALSEDKSF